MPRTRYVRCQHILGKSVGAFKAYSSYMSMLDRCYKPDHQAYPNYGGRGVKVCLRWRESFANFIEDMGDRPPGKTLDRIDNDGDYHPENCRWATRKEQLRNRRCNKRVTYQGKTLCLSEWAELYGIDYINVFHPRIRRGWSFERALTTPVGRYLKRGHTV